MLRWFLWSSSKNNNISLKGEKYKIDNIKGENLINYNTLFKSCDLVPKEWYLCLY